jgi:RES domain-containing protein
MNDDLDIPLLKEAAAWITLTTALRDGDPLPDPTHWDALLDGVLACRYSAKPGWEVYRARVMPFEQELDAEPLPCASMGPPPPGLAKAGRLNPAGVPYFYGGLDPETAMAEARPWRRARISVGRFVTTSALALADLTGGFATSKPNRSVQWLSFMLGRPVHRDDSESYLPSQRIAEKCRAEGLSGVSYDSSLKPGGVNVALFVHSEAVCRDVELHEVTGVSFSTQRLFPLGMTPTST